MLEKISLQEAGELLGISPDAVRMRIKRGKMQGEKDEAGRWQVWIDTEGEQEAEQEPERGSVDDVDDLRLRVAVLEAQLEATEDERDYLRQQVQTLTMAQAVMAQGQAQKAIEAEKRPRRWRWPWERKA